MHSRDCRSLSRGSCSAKTECTCLKRFYLALKHGNYIRGQKCAYTWALSEARFCQVRPQGRGRLAAAEGRGQHHLLWPRYAHPILMLTLILDPFMLLLSAALKFLHWPASTSKPVPLLTRYPASKPKNEPMSIHIADRWQIFS